MKLFKRIMLATLSLCMTLGIVGFLAACGDTKNNNDDVEYTVTVTCNEASVLTGVKVGLASAQGGSVEGGEARALTDGKATFTAAAGTYNVVLSGVPDTYQYENKTVSKEIPAVIVVLTLKNVGPDPDDGKVTIDAKYNGTWSNKDHTVVVDAANGAIKLDGVAATDIAKAEDGGYTFKVNGTTWSLYFSAQSDELCLDDGEDYFATLKSGAYVPPTPVESMPANFPVKWLTDEEDPKTIEFDGATFTYMDEDGIVTAIEDKQDGTLKLTALYMDEVELVFTYTPADYTLTFTVFDSPMTFYAEGHLPFHIDGAFDGTWTSEDGSTTIVIDAEAGTIAVEGDIVTNIAKTADGKYTFIWNEETCSIYFSEDDYTTLYFKCGDADPVAFTQESNTPADPLGLPKELNGTYYEGTGMQIAIKIEDKAVTAAIGDAFEGTITAYNAATKTLTVTGPAGADAAAPTLALVFDAKNGTLTASDLGGGTPAVFYKELPTTSNPAGFANLNWHTDAQGDDRVTITFLNGAGAKFTYLGKEGRLYLTKQEDENTWTLYAIHDGKFLEFTWDPKEGALTLHGDPETVFYDHEVFDPTAFLALGLNGTWYADAFQTGAIAIRLTFTKDSLDVKFALNNTDNTGKVTWFDEKTKTITAVIIDTYYFVYDEATGRITDGSADGQESTKSYGPYIRYDNDFNSQTSEKPEWYDFTFASSSGEQLTFNGNNVVIGDVPSQIRHYDKDANGGSGALIILNGGKHATLTYDGYNILTCTWLKGGVDTYNKAPDAIDPQLEWLSEYAWKAEDGSTVEFDGKTVKLHVTGAEWTGYFTEHIEKTLKAYFIGHGMLTFTYDDTASPKTIKVTVNGKEIAFKQEIPLTLPKALEGTTWNTNSTTYFDAPSITFDENNEKVTFAGSGNIAGNWDIYDVTHDEDAKKWTFKVNANNNSYTFEYVEDPESLKITSTYKDTLFAKYVEPDVSPDELWKILNGTEWKGDNTTYFSSNINFSDRKVNINGTNYTTDDSKTIYDAASTTWTITFQTMMNWYVFKYNTETNTLVCDIMRYGTTFVVAVNFTKQGGETDPALTLPSEIFQSTWTSDNTSYGYSFVFTSATKVTIQPSSSYQAYDCDITDLHYDTDTKTWTFTALWTTGMLTYKYAFTYVEGANTITVGMYRSATASGDPAYTITLTKNE